MENNLGQEANYIRVLVLDDDPLIRKWMRSELLKDSFTKEIKFLEADCVDAAIEVLAQENPQILILDKNLSTDPSDAKSDGINFIPEILKIRPNVQIIVHTSCEQTDDIVRAIRYGAFSYVTKGSNLFVEQVKKALSVYQLSLEHSQGRLGATQDFKDKTISSSLAMRKVLNEIEAFSFNDWPVLLLGESGVGKTTIAQQMYLKRKTSLKNPNGQFFSISLAGMHKESIVRELFGSEPGAYTGSSRTHQGYFEVANGGTLFIDEIGEISQEVQALLLKAIDEKQITRMGSTTPIRTNFKLICATNRNLFDMVERGEFREDLFMRISKSTIQVPSIKERKEDVPELVQALFPKILIEARIIGVSDKIPADFVEAIANNPPRGNIRGIERALGDLLMYAPKDSKGKSVLALWTTVPELSKYLGTESSITQKSKHILSYADLKASVFQMVDDNFPGFDTVMNLVERKLLIEVSKKYKKNIDRASVLKLENSRCARKYKEHAIAPASSASIKSKELSH